jgi:hypothetical protein
MANKRHRRTKKRVRESRKEMEGGLFGIKSMGVAKTLGLKSQETALKDQIRDSVRQETTTNAFGFGDKDNVQKIQLDRQAKIDKVMAVHSKAQLMGVVIMLCSHIYDTYIVERAEITENDAAFFSNELVLLIKQVMAILNGYHALLNDVFYTPGMFQVFDQGTLKRFMINPVTALGGTLTGAKQEDNSGKSYPSQSDPQRAIIDIQLKAIEEFNTFHKMEFVQQGENVTTVQRTDPINNENKLVLSDLKKTVNTENSVPEPTGHDTANTDTSNPNTNNGSNDDGENPHAVSEEAEASVNNPPSAVLKRLVDVIKGSFDEKTKPPAEKYGVYVVNIDNSNMPRNIIHPYLPLTSNFFKEFQIIKNQIMFFSLFLEELVKRYKAPHNMTNQNTEYRIPKFGTIEYKDFKGDVESLPDRRVKQIIDISDKLKSLSKSYQTSVMLGKQMVDPLFTLSNGLKGLLVSAPTAALKYSADMLKKTLRRGGKKGKRNAGKRRKQTRRRRVKSGSGMFATFKSTLYRTYTKNDSFFPVFGWSYPTSIKNLSNAYHKKYMFIMFFDAIYKLFMENAFRYDVDLTKNDTPLSQEDEDESDEIKKQMTEFANETKNKIQEFKDLAIIYNKIVDGSPYISDSITDNHNKIVNEPDGTSICKNSAYNTDYDQVKTQTNSDPKSLLGKFCLDKQMLEQCKETIVSNSSNRDKLMNIYRDYELKGDVMGFVKDLYNSNSNNNINIFLEKSGQRTTSRSMFKSITQVAYKVGSMAINGGKSYLILKLEQLLEETDNKIKNLEKELKKQDNLDKIKKWEELITNFKKEIITESKPNTNVVNNKYKLLQGTFLPSVIERRFEYIRTNLLTDPKYNSVKDSPNIYDFLNEENKKKADYVFFKTLRESIHTEKGYMVQERASTKVDPKIEAEVMQYTNIKLTGFKDEFKELLRKKDERKNKEMEESVKEIEGNITAFDKDPTEDVELTEKLWGDEVKTYMINIIKERIYDDAYKGINPQPEEAEPPKEDSNQLGGAETNKEEVSDYKKPHKANVIKYEKMISVYTKYQHIAPNLTDKLSKLKDIMTACMNVSPIMFDYINKQLIPAVVGNGIKVDSKLNLSNDLKNTNSEEKIGTETYVFLDEFVKFLHEFLSKSKNVNETNSNNQDTAKGKPPSKDELFAKKHFLDMYLSVINSKLEIYTRFSGVEQKTQTQSVSTSSESQPSNDNQQSKSLIEILQDNIDMKTTKIKEINQKISSISLPIDDKVLQTFNKTLETEMRVNTYLAFMGYLLERNLDKINAQNDIELEKTRLRIVGEATAMAAAGGVILASSPFILLGGIIVGPVVGVLAGLRAVVYESYKLATHETQYFIHKEYMLKTIVDLYGINIRVNRVHKNAERDGLIAKIEYYETLKSLKNLINTNAAGAIQRLNETRNFFNELGPYTAIYAYPTTEIYSKGILPSGLTSDKTKLIQTYFIGNALTYLNSKIYAMQKTIINKYLTSYIEDFQVKQGLQTITNVIMKTIAQDIGLNAVDGLDAFIKFIIEQSKSKSFIVNSLNPFKGRTASTAKGGKPLKSDKTKTRRRNTTISGGADSYSTFRTKFVNVFYKAIFDQMKPSINGGQDKYKQQLDALARAKVRVGQLLDLCVKRVKDIVPAMIEHHIYDIVKTDAIQKIPQDQKLEIEQKITEIEDYYKSIHKSKIHTKYVDALQIKKSFFGIAKTMISKGFKRMTRSLVRNAILSLKFIYKNGIFGLLMISLTVVSWGILFVGLDPGTALAASWGIAQIRNLLLVVAAPFIEMPEMIITRSNEIMSTCKALTPYKNVFSSNNARQYDFLTDVTVNSSKMAEYVNKMYFGLKMKYNLEEVDENDLIQNPIKTIIIQCIDLKLLTFDTEEIRIYKKRQIANIRNKPANTEGENKVAETEDESSERIAKEVEQIIGVGKQTALLEKINKYMREYGLTTTNTAINIVAIGLSPIEGVLNAIQNIKLLMDIEDDNIKDEELREQIINTGNP